MSGTKLLVTDRLVLRKVTMNDAHDLFINWASDIKTNEYLTFKCHDTEETTKKVISYWLKKYEENGFEWCIEIKDTKEVIGVISANTSYKYNTLDNFAKVCYKGDSQALKDAEIGKVYTMNSFMSQNTPENVSATSGTATAYKVKCAKGATQFTVSDGTAKTGTIKAGDKLIVNGYLFEVAEDVTLADGAGTLKVTEKIPFTLSEATSATIINKAHSLGFHRNGLALVTRSLELPQGAAKAAIASADGLAVRVVFGYDQDTKKDKISFDIIYGIKELDSDLLVDFA